MTENCQFPKAIMVLGLLLAIGMATAAFILGVLAKRAVSGQQFIIVKGWQKNQSKRIVRNDD